MSNVIIPNHPTTVLGIPCQTACGYPTIRIWYPDPTTTRPIRNTGTAVRTLITNFRTVIQQSVIRADTVPAHVDGWVVRTARAGISTHCLFGFLSKNPKTHDPNGLEDFWVVIWTHPKTQNPFGSCLTTTHVIMASQVK